MEPAEKKELIETIGALNSEIYDLKESNRLLSESSSPMSKSAFDFLETERNAMNEAYESEIKSLKQELNAEKESSKKIIDNLQKNINHLMSQQSTLQNELNSVQGQLSKCQSKLEEQQTINLALEEHSHLEYDRKSDNEVIENLKQKVILLTSQIKEQEQIRQREQLNYTNEINKLTAQNTNSSQIYHNSHNNCSSNNGDISSKNEEIFTLQNQLNIMKKNNNEINKILQQEINEKTKISQTLHQKQIDFSKQLSQIQKENADYKTIFTTLQSLFNTFDTTDIILSIQKLFAENAENSKIRENYHQMKRLLDDEIRKNNQLQLQLHSFQNHPIQTNTTNSTSSSVNNENVLKRKISQLENEIVELKQANSLLISQNKSNDLSEKDNLIKEQENLIEKLNSKLEEFENSKLSDTRKYEESIQNCHLEILNLENKINQYEQEIQTIHINHQNEIEQLNSNINSNHSLSNSNSNTLNTNDSNNFNTNKSSDSNTTNTTSSNGSNHADSEDYQIMKNRLLYAANLIDEIENKTQSSEALRMCLENFESDEFEANIKMFIDTFNFENNEGMLARSQVISAYDQICKFYESLKFIFDKVEIMNESINNLWMKRSIIDLLTDPNLDQEYGQNFNNDYEHDYGQIDNEIDQEFGQEHQFEKYEGSFMSFNSNTNRKANRGGRLSHSNSPFKSLLDSPKINRNSSIIEHSPAEVQNLPKKTSRIPLSTRQNGVLSNKQSYESRSKPSSVHEPKSRRF
ncbi:hypothetical protein TRFO_28341 [Tritrichomonas foetus]|uniref:Uncharacterized protein n=1 Tax=Tritrichomonas foetus TaxID=1144522 RepID=A0A1J4K413_9EUKA|nr:hypothetical protein TRFO_28341 [Tritrichomonas foetus]|eukprot:OHT04229.1 hypothetical protein TRFO_28341 [Tritrichomonas foetus]